MNREEITAIRNELAEARNSLADEAKKDYSNTDEDPADARLFTMGQLSYDLGTLIRRLDIELNKDLAQAGAVSAEAVCDCGQCEFCETESPAPVDPNDPPKGSLTRALQDVIAGLRIWMPMNGSQPHEIICLQAEAIGQARSRIQAIIDGITEQV